MREDNEKESHFKMRMDNGFEDPETPLDVDDMRLEKLNTRVTIISVMIPVLIVIVLVIAYLDIQKRVMHTEDTGSMSIQVSHPYPFARPSWRKSSSAISTALVNPPPVLRSGSRKWMTLSRMPAPCWSARKS
jgi:hypothetical protein